MPILTAKELKEALKDVPDDCVIVVGLFEANYDIKEVKELKDLNCFRLVMSDSLKFIHQ